MNLLLCGSLSFGGSTPTICSTMALVGVEGLAVGMKCEDVEDGPEVVSQYVSLSCENMLVLVKIGDDQWQLSDCLTGSTAILNGRSFELVCVHMAWPWCATQ